MNINDIKRQVNGKEQLAGTWTQLRCCAPA